MPPSKSSRAHDDAKSEAPTTKEKNGGGHTSTKMRRIASQQSSAASRDAAAAATAAALLAHAAPVQAAPPSIQWSSFDREVLHSYAREHDLKTPTSFCSTYHNTILSHPAGIGKYSPSMSRKRKIHRQSREDLARTVRKHFNGVGIQENDIIVEFIHKLRADKLAKPPEAGIQEINQPRD